MSDIVITRRAGERIVDKKPGATRSTGKARLNERFAAAPKSRGRPSRREYLSEDEDDAPLSHRVRHSARAVDAPTRAIKYYEEEEEPRRPARRGRERVYVDDEDDEYELVRRPRRGGAVREADIPVRRVRVARYESDDDELYRYSTGRAPRRRRGNDLDYGYEERVVRSSGRGGRRGGGGGRGGGRRGGSRGARDAFEPYPRGSRRGGRGGRGGGRGGRGGRGRKRQHEPSRIEQKERDRSSIEGNWKHDLFDEFDKGQGGRGWSKGRGRGGSRNGAATRADGLQTYDNERVDMSKDARNGLAMDNPDA